MYVYPTDINEFYRGTIFQIKDNNSKQWDPELLYEESSSIINEGIQNLINKKRIRIILR